MTDGGGWQTVVDPREARRRVKEAERKEKAAEDRHRAQQQREAAQAERERKEQELRAARDTSFSIDIDHSALNNKSQGVKKSTTRRRQLKRKKAAQQAPTPEHSNKSLSSTVRLSFIPYPRSSSSDSTPPCRLHSILSKSSWAL